MSQKDNNPTKPEQTTAKANNVYVIKEDMK